MANVYGVANTNPPPSFWGTIGGTDINCPAGVETNVVAATPTAPTYPGMFYPFATGVITITIGATPPGQVVMALRIGSGSDINTIFVWATLMTAGAHIPQSVSFYGYTVAISNPSATTIFNLTVNPSGQAVTVNAGGTYAWASWLRAPDQ